MFFSRQSRRSRCSSGSGGLTGAQRAALRRARPVVTGGTACAPAAGTGVVGVVPGSTVIDHLCGNIFEDFPACVRCSTWLSRRNPSLGNVFRPSYGPVQTHGAVLRLCDRRPLRPRPAGARVDGYIWSARDEWLHRAGGSATPSAWFTLVPRRFRRHPRTRAGRDRANGRTPADLPWRRSRRNLPPVDERDNPGNRCPNTS